MTILVTGGSGFIGSNFIRLFKKRSKKLIVNVDNLSFYKNKINIIKKKNYHFYPFDICNNKQMEFIFKKYNPSLVINFAAKTHVDNSIKESSNFFKTNVNGVLNLLYHSLQLHKNKKKILFFQISTDEVFGSLRFNSLRKFNEKSLIAPNNPYSASKASAEHIVFSFNKTYGLPTIITNCSNNYGQFQHPEKLIPKTIDRIIRNKIIPIYGNGKNMREWLHVEDHCNAIIKILNNVDDKYSRICIGSKNLLTNQYVVNKICAIADKHFGYNKTKSTKKLIRFVDDRLGHDLKYSINSKLIKKNFFWEEKKSFDQGLEETFMWYIKNKNWTQSIKQNYK